MLSLKIDGVAPQDCHIAGANKISNRWLYEFGCFLVNIGARQPTIGDSQGNEAHDRQADKQWYARPRMGCMCGVHEEVGAVRCARRRQAK